MSIDAGRYVWARSQMQAAVDASALAASQSLPAQADATQKATDYWLDDSGFIHSQGSNITFGVSYPPGNKKIAVEASTGGKFFNAPNEQQLHDAFLAISKLTHIRLSR